jgi:CheY-like chemotaxis protein
MPEMTGDKLAKRLREIRPDIPVILCTGYSSKVLGKSPSELGIQALLFKPVVHAVLAGTIRKVLDKKNNEQG